MVTLYKYLQLKGMDGWKLNDIGEWGMEQEAQGEYWREVEDTWRTLHPRVHL